jgi:hypothetical protein
MQVSRLDDFDKAAAAGYSAYHLTVGEAHLGALAVGGRAECRAVVGNLEARAAGDHFDRLALYNSRRQAQVAGGEGFAGR